ncbi:hypothetical protein [Marinitoga lauensis]|uniref:hypothetical protein n=1 Tax=Marinitoga lauensis TaxID=2201189 RepID=UPI00101213AD|nr:hypothetical protein [Marinitoga lauensis]
MVFELIFRLDPIRYGIKKTSLSNKKKREKAYINSLSKLLDEIIDFSYYWNKEKRYEEIYIEGRLKFVRSIRLNKVRKVLYRQLVNDEVIAYNPSGEIENVFLESVVFEE